MIIPSWTTKTKFCKKQIQFSLFVAWIRMRNQRPAGVQSIYPEIYTRSLQSQLQIALLYPHCTNCSPQEGKLDENHLLSPPQEVHKTSCLLRKLKEWSSPVTEAVTPTQQGTVMSQLTDLQRSGLEERTGNKTTGDSQRGKVFLYLISAPAPKSQHGESKYKARPRNVPCDWVPEQMKGILTWEVTGCVWDYDLGYSCAVFLLKSFIPANFFESWKENANNLILFPYLSLPIAFFSVIFLSSLYFSFCSRFWQSKHV